MWYINSYEDALVVLYAVKLGFIDVVKKRLSIFDKQQIESGDIFCFIESTKGIRRWTDGKIWSPSKIQDDFLVYLEVCKFFSKTAILKRRAAGKDSEYYSSKMDDNVTGLCKKTISFTSEGLTYHIISYYRPVLARYSLKDIPFFKSLKAALERHPKLKDSSYIEKIPTKYRTEFLTKVYGILNPEISMQKRSSTTKDIEKVAVEGLTLLFNGLK